MKRKYYCTNPVYDFKHLYNVICNSDGFGTRNLNFWVLVTRIGSKMGFIKGKLNMDSLYFIYFWHICGFSNVSGLPVRALQYEKSPLYQNIWGKNVVKTNLHFHKPSIPEPSLICNVIKFSNHIWLWPCLVSHFLHGRMFNIIENK